MTVLSISIEASSIQLIAGIPKTVTLSTNIPASIFYTLDGTTPTTASTVYTNPIAMPSDAGSVTLKIFATNGEISSAVVTETYAVSVLGQRKAHATVTSLGEGSVTDNYPFSSPVSATPIKYGNTGGIIADSPDVPNQELGGYDAEGNRVGGTDLPEINYDYITLNINSIGEIGKNIGRLPKVTIKSAAPGPVSTSSNTAERLFNPKAMVIYQSYDNPPDHDITNLNRISFSLDNPNTQQTGAMFYTTALNGPTATGGFLRSQFNQRTNEITYYYYDNYVCRWIISKEKYTPTTNDVSQLYKIVFSSRDTGAGTVFRWLPFAYRALIQ